MVIATWSTERGPGDLRLVEVSSFSMRILDYAAGGLAQKAQDRGVVEQSKACGGPKPHRICIK